MSIDPAIQTLLIQWAVGSVALLGLMIVLETLNAYLPVLRGPLAMRTLDALQSVAIMSLMFTVLFAMFFAFLSLA